MEIVTRGNGDSRLVACQALLRGKYVATFREIVGSIVEIETNLTTNS